MEEDSIYISKSEGSEIDLLIFGGIRNGIGMPLFEFLSFLQPYKINKYFIRDLNQSWYNLGVTDISIDVPTTLKYLQELLSSRNEKNKLIVLGNSAGGYAAILFGNMLNADKIIAISPQTFLNKFNRFRYRDKRWGLELKRLHGLENSGIYLDLRALLNKNPHYNSKTTIVYSRIDRLDGIHARRMKKPFIELLEFDKGGHDLIKEMRDNGTLKVLLDRELMPKKK